MIAKRTLLFGLAAAVMCFSATAGAQDPNSPETKARLAMVGKQAPELKVDQWINTDGKTFSLADLHGKVVVLDFFTFW